MSFFGDVANFTRRLLMLETRVEENAKTIYMLRQDLDALMRFTEKVASAVKRNEERRVDQQEILVQKLKIQLLELERDLSGRGTNLYNSDSGQKRLPEDGVGRE